MAKSRSSTRRGATAVDEVIGARIRARRGELQMSQEVLAGELGITFQQIQKYESGKNRVSASTLLDLAVALKTEPSAFMPPANPRVAGLSGLQEQELARLLMRLNEDGRRVLLGIARTLVADDQFRPTRKRGED